MSESQHTPWQYSGDSRPGWGGRGESVVGIAIDGCDGAAM